VKAHLKTTMFCIALITCLSACSEKKETAADAELRREFMASAQETARSLAKYNPKHDAQYYLDRMVELLNSCTRGGDLDETCYRNGLQRLKNE